VLKKPRVQQSSAIFETVRRLARLFVATPAGVATQSFVQFASPDFSTESVESGRSGIIQRQAKQDFGCWQDQVPPRDRSMPANIGRHTIKPPRRTGGFTGRHVPVTWSSPACLLATRLDQNGTDGLITSSMADCGT
jgi:hypothetical protein